VHLIFTTNIVGNKRQTFKKYDFVGLVERFDESLVALQLLLGLESSDILYFAVNRRDQWKRTMVSHKRSVCRDSFDWKVDLAGEPRIREYLLESKEWYARNYADYLLYQAAALSLDQTIMAIGLDFFSQELKKFRSLMKQANEECSPIFACSSNGTDQSEDAKYDCMAEEIYGCGFPCLDGLTA